MSQLSPVGGLPLGSQDTRSTADAINNVDLDDFLKLMITELQNQDPLNPLDNAQMLQQISQIRDVGATDRLTDTLGTVLLRQNIASATSLIGEEIEGQANDGQQARGIVQRVSIVDGTPRLHIEGDTTAEAVPGAGGVEQGTYDYRVVFDGLNPDGTSTLFAVDVGPVETTGTPEQDQAILLNNLPLTDGKKLVYRTDASGTGDYHFVGQIDGDQSRYTDTRGDAELSGSILTEATTAHSGGRRYTVTLDNLAAVRGHQESGE